MQREAIGLAVVTVLAGACTCLLAARVLWLPAGDERRQPADIAVVVLLLWPRLRLLLIGERLCFTRQIRLRLARAVRRIAARLHRLLVAGAIFLAVLERVVAHVAAHVVLRTVVELRVLLAELL